MSSWFNLLYEFARRSVTDLEFVPSQTLIDISNE